MYSSKITKNTSICSTRKVKNFMFGLMTILFLSGCSKDVSSTPVLEPEIQEIITTVATPTPTPSIEPTPTPKPSASVIEGEEVDVSTAQLLIGERIDTTKYSLTLLTDQMEIDSQEYIAFIASTGTTPLEPILLVNKKNGKLFCMSSEGKCIAFGNFPSNPTDTIKDTYEWSGTYYRKDKYDRIIGTLQVQQNDSSSFEFMLYCADSTTSATFAGIGHIDGDYAIFTDESDHELVFQISEEAITLFDDDELFTKNGLAIGGSYNFATYETSEDYRISIEDAVTTLSQLTSYQTKLPANLSEYTLIPESKMVIVKDRICYVIGAYAEFEEQQVLITKLYFSIDGTVAFAYDSNDQEPYAIIPFY